MKTTYKKSKLFLSTILTGSLFLNAFSQENAAQQKSSVVVANIDVINPQKYSSIDERLMSNLVRVETEKLEKYLVLGKYDVAEMVEKKGMSLEKCYSTNCLINIGKTINSDKVLGGDIEFSTNKIVFSLRLIDTQSERLEKSKTVEFLNNPSEIEAITAVMLKELFELEQDQNLKTKLVKKYDYDGIVNNPNAEVLKLSGTRMGITVFSGSVVKRLQAPKEEGGANAFPAMFQFGYQFEKQYLNEGNFQALFEFIPTVTGLDQGILIPAFTLMHGIRNNKNGWEFAFGPSFSLVPKAKGFYSADNKWHLASELDNDSTGVFDRGNIHIKEELDMRGELQFQSAFVIAVGKTFKSGRLNIPVNAYFIPAKDGFRTGLSFGFNSKKRNSNSYPNPF